MKVYEVVYSKRNIIQVTKLIKPIVKRSNVMFINGEVGSGKTFLTKNLLQALGNCQNVTSPTFSIFKKYTLPEIQVFHYDLYRIKHSSELDFLDIDDNIENGFLIFEWSQIAREYGIIPDIEIDILYAQNSGERLAKIVLY